ncbi:MAG: peptide/nickel transport system substrate-binding protein [Gaiellales bacterium]|nr:peptide/nickel transport system substrate-binding protein [Gaiellales bacterium]
MTDQQDQRSQQAAHDRDFRLSRAALLRGTAGAMLAASPLVAAACGGSSTSSTAGSTGAGKPVRGGTLRAGYIGGGTAETLNPYIAVTPIDEARVQSLYDPLVLTNADLSSSPGLALEWNANADATEYVVKLRPGVEFHNSKTFGADDLIYSIRLMAKPANFGSVPFVQGIDLKGLQKIDATTVKIPLLYPDADLAANFVYYNTWIVQDGETDFTNPVGTGPFMFESFKPGTQSVFKRNPNYWVTGKPYADALQITTIDDNTARLDALLSGQIDLMAQLAGAQAKAHQASGDITVLLAKSPQPLMFYMDTTQKPFTDNNVRLAMKLIADRPALVAGAISGFGTVGNDIVGAGLPFYDTQLPQRVQDIAQAKSLLHKAGQDNLTVTLMTSPVISGFVESATLLSQQAKAAGVNIQLKQVPPSSYYNPQLLYLKMAFAQTQWPPPSLKFFYLQALSSKAAYNETHWNDKAWNDLLFKAIGELDQTKAQDYWNQVQEIQYNQGGYLSWTNADWVDGISNKVKGLQPSAAGILGNHRFLDAWLST